MATVADHNGSESATVEGRSNQSSAASTPASSSIKGSSKPSAAIEGRSQPPTSSAIPLGESTAPTEASGQRRSSRIQERKARSQNRKAFINNLFAVFGIGNNNGSSTILTNYVDFNDLYLKKPLPEPCIPLETAMYPDENSHVAEHLAKVLELQQMDKFIEKEDEWTIIKVYGHASRRVKRRIRKEHAADEISNKKHIRLDVMFRDGDRKWVSMDAAILQDPIPVVEYVEKNKSVYKEFDIDEYGNKRTQSPGVKTTNKRTQSPGVKTTENVLGDIDHVVVPYVLKCGSMTYKHQDDYDRLEVLEITSGVQWNPPKFNKSNFIYSDAVGIIHHYLHNDLIGTGASTRSSSVSGTPSRSVLMRNSACPAPLDLTETSYVRRDVAFHSTFRGDDLAEQCPPFRGADDTNLGLPAGSTLRWMVDLMCICVPIWIHWFSHQMTATLKTSMIELLPNQRFHGLVMRLLSRCNRFIV